MDPESASAYVLTHFTGPLLAVVGVIVGAVLVRRASTRRRARSGPFPAAAPPPVPRPDPRVTASASSPACADHGHDLVVEHDRRTGLPATIRCARAECGAAWDAVADTPSAGVRPRAAEPSNRRSLGRGA